jgi:hypothetical protein
LNTYFKLIGILIVANVITHVILKTGLDLGEIQKLQQAKIEELTLYLIAKKKRT